MRKIAQSLYTSMFLFFAYPGVALSADWSDDCAQDVVLKNGQVVTDVATLRGIECAFANVVGVVLSLAGIILFVMFLLGGFKYMTSGGDPKAVESAKQTLTYAIGGLVVLILSYIALLVIEGVTGVPVSKFRIAP